MPIFPLLMICACISFAAYGTIALTGRHSSSAEKEFTARNRALFKQSFPFLWWTSILTFVILFLCFLFNMSNFTPEKIGKLMDKQFSIIDHLIPLTILLAILLPTSLKNYSTASEELKENKPFLFLTVLLMTFFYSLTLSLVLILLIKK